MSKKYDFSELSFLIVDDNAHMISIIKTLLKGLGIHKVVECTDAANALEELRTSTIDVIILDYAMETVDGIEFTRLVRTAKDSPNPYVPIIMLTARTERSRVIEARDSGVTEFMSKPVCANDLYRRIVEVVARPREFTRTKSYLGPDRRRRTLEAFAGKEKRETSFDLDESGSMTPDSTTG